MLSIKTSSFICHVAVSTETTTKSFNDLKNNIEHSLMYGYWKNHHGIEIDVLFKSMKDMVTSLRKREKEYGLSRMMSGYSWKWISRNPKSLPDANIDGVDLTWNRVSSDWINSTTDATEMGCIHTVQGDDLNFAGVIFGEEISFNKSTNSIVVNKANYHDTKGKAAIEDEIDLHDYIIKIYKTMMLRGIFGTYVYVCNSDLREYFSQFLISK